MVTTIPDLPAAGTNSWLSWAAGMDSAARELQAIPPGGTATAPRPALALVYSSTFPTALRPSATSADVYVWVCDGTADEVQINAALDAVRINDTSGTAGSRSGMVLLMGDYFSTAAAIKLRTGSYLRGGSLGCEIRAASSWGGGLVELYDAGTHLTKLTDLWLHPNGTGNHGLLYVADGGQVFTAEPSTNPDPSHVIRDLYISEVGGSTNHFSGMVLRGANLRAGKYSDIRILGTSGCGVWVDGAVDSHYTNIEVGSAGSRAGGVPYSVTSTDPVGHGFFVSQGDNNMFTACKAWFSRGAGYYNRGTRNGYMNCQSQDNYSHGFHDAYGKSTFVGCHADSNGRADGADARGRAGFYMAGGSAVVSGCLSYDKAESSSGSYEQWYGFQFTTGFARSRVTGCVTYGNGVINVVGGGSQTGSVGTGTTVDIAADANGG